MNTLRVQVVKTHRTDLMCIHCGRFGARDTLFALVAPSVDEAEAFAGIHRKCLPFMKAKRVVRMATKTEPSPPPAHDEETFEQRMSRMLEPYAKGARVRARLPIVWADGEVEEGALGTVVEGRAHGCDGLLAIDWSNLGVRQCAADNVERAEGDHGLV